MTLEYATRDEAAFQPAMSRTKHPRSEVLIVDDQPIFRQGLRRVLDGVPDLHVCCEVETLDGARAAIDQFSPDLLIAEIDLVKSDGMELIRKVRRSHVQLPILVLSTYDETIYAERMLHAGANGYIMKHTESAELLFAMRQVLDGGVYVSKTVGKGMINTYVTGRQGSSVEPIELLSNRELQILQMIGKGLSTRESAEVLHLSIKTIESHRQRIKNKLNLKSGVQLVQYAVSDRFARCS